MKWRRLAKSKQRMNQCLRTPVANDPTHPLLWETVFQGLETNFMPNGDVLARIETHFE